MKDYSKLSDLEVNKAVAEALGYVEYYKQTEIEEFKGLVCIDENGKRSWHDWIREYADWAQLLVDNKIDLVWCDELNEWQTADGKAYSIENQAAHYDTKPGRAVAICFLMMQDAKD